MNQKIVWISPWRTLAVVAPISFVLGYPLIGLLWVFNQFAASPGRPNWMAFVLLPVALAISASLLAVIAVWAYNGVARFGPCLLVRMQASDQAEPAQTNVTADDAHGQAYRF